MAGAYDGVADFYRQEFASELDSKPFDRALLTQLADRLHVEGHELPVLEVGSGPGHIGAFLAVRGVNVIASDASPGQIIQARVLDGTRPLLVADLASVPCRESSLAGIVAYYCLIFGPPDPLDSVFEDWSRVVRPGGVVLLAVHAGSGSLTFQEWQGRRVDLTIELRDPDDLARRLRNHGFTIEQHVTRPPGEDESTDRCYVVARREGAAGGER